ncbi:phytanoyl-CoA dioxygenase family protein [Sphingobium sp. TomTYG45]
MNRDGACIIRDMLSPEILKALQEDVAPWIEQTANGRDEWAGRKTKRTGGLIARCPTVREIAVDPLILGAANATLRPYCSKIQLNITQLITIMPGQGAQPLHRDRFVWGGDDSGGVIPEAIEPQCNGIWAVEDFTEENGATHVVPGSHKWPFTRQARRDESVQAVMKAGSVLLYNGTVIHSGGENCSTVARKALNVTYTLGWLRQEKINISPARPKSLAISTSNSPTSSVTASATIHWAFTLIRSRRGSIATSCPRKPHSVDSPSKSPEWYKRTPSRSQADRFAPGERPALPAPRPRRSRAQRIAHRDA